METEAKITIRLSIPARDLINKEAAAQNESQQDFIKQAIKERIKSLHAPKKDPEPANNMDFTGMVKIPDNYLDQTKKQAEKLEVSVEYLVETFFRFSLKNLKEYNKTESIPVETQETPSKTNSKEHPWKSSPKISALEGNTDYIDHLNDEEYDDNYEAEIEIDFDMERFNGPESS